MQVTQSCFCRDAAGSFGIASQYKDGLLYVRFEDGARWVNPSELNFI